MSELPLVQKSGGCGCGCNHDAEVPTLVAREIPHAIRHGAIIGALQQLPTGGGQMDLVAPHVPTPLLDQIGQLFGDEFSHEVLDPTPEAYRIRFTRR
ncbi:DUF2249 domain-containing protein [Luteococcus peritonei]|uniref:DUF2249 domain-containing protein n=1 Tax=Luteococcus peritonei TaxID=88874 RepID=A0ABW4RX50_9ACTN